MTSLREGVNYCLVDFFRKGVGSQPSDQPKVFQPKSFSVMGEGGGATRLSHQSFPPKKQVFWGISLSEKFRQKVHDTIPYTLVKICLIA